DGSDWIEGAIAACKRCEGAFSLVVGTPGGILATRDPHGIRPLVLGHIGNTSPQENGEGGYGPCKYVVASEP
ncbi:MAG: amidophosphoribosyltransferase, partial [Phormidesmis sp.]